jgi:hypothetical protein
LKQSIAQSDSADTSIVPPPLQRPRRQQVVGAVNAYDPDGVPDAANGPDHLVRLAVVGWRARVKQDLLGKNVVEIRD